MTDNNIIYITKEGLQKLQDELSDLKTNKRKEVSERIKEAKELGDLSENAEYQGAKDEQGAIETRIMELEQQIKNSEVITHKKNTTDVQIGSHISVADSNGMEMSYTIVGSSEANPAKMLISNESPIGAAFLGHKVGDTVTVKTPAGETQYTIKTVE